MKDILDLHTHTLASGHAYSTIKEMAESALREGKSDEYKSENCRGGIEKPGDDRIRNLWFGDGVQ